MSPQDTDAVAALHELQALLGRLDRHLDRVLRERDDALDSVERLRAQLAQHCPPDQEDNLDG